MEKWRIVIDLSYQDKATCIKEFERVFTIMKERNWSKCWGGSGSNYYGIKGPSVERLSDEEIIKLRDLIK